MLERANPERSLGKWFETAAESIWRHLSAVIGQKNTTDLILHFDHSSRPTPTIWVFQMQPSLESNFSIICWPFPQLTRLLLDWSTDYFDSVSMRRVSARQVQNWKRKTLKGWAPWEPLAHTLVLGWKCFSANSTSLDNSFKKHYFKINIYSSQEKKKFPG